jgi:diguanylate cyclase (GGDEF)-like protein/PAS domain S-box-containing protein
MTLLDRLLAAAPAAHAEGADLQHWRSDLLQRWLRVAVLAGAAPTLLAVLASVLSGSWHYAQAACLAWSCFALATWHSRPSYRMRVAAVLLTLSGVGLWLLFHGGSMGLSYLLACPVMAALLLGARTAVGLLLASTVALVGVGWLADPAIPTVAGLGQLPGIKWLIRGLQFLSLGLAMTLSCAYLLRRLEGTLARARATAQSLRDSEDQLRQIAATVPGMVFRLRVAPGGRISYLYASPGSLPLFGVPAAELLADGTRLWPLVADDDRPRLLRAIARSLAQASTLELDIRVQLPGGSSKWVHISSTEVARDEQGVVHNGIMVDVSERKAADQRVWRQAHFDSLTGLANRRLLRQRLHQALVRSRQAQRPLALMLIDLDHFKEVNDTLGHDRGDQLLVQAARRIRGCVRDDDAVARMGGDEFCVMLADVDEAGIDAVAARIITALTEVFALGAEQAFVSASIGIAHYPHDADGVRGLLKHADQALYAAKDAGRNRVHRFTQSLQDRAQLRMRLGNDLRHALALQQLQLVYQPIIDLRSGQVLKAEALLRWQHPRHGPVSPADFIPIAESTGLIGDIGDWVFRTAAAQALAWRRQLHPRFQISVNRSPLQFRNDPGQRVPWAEQLAALGLPGDAIAVEITEGLLLDNGPCVAAQLQALRAAGMALSLDDFGTGYSAMAYLRSFELDYLKIDRSFVSGLGGGDGGASLCKAIIVMAHELGLKVIAEGVETEAQHHWLQAAGCDLAQGYLFARPLPAEAFEAWLAARLQQPRPLALAP